MTMTQEEMIDTFMEGIDETKDALIKARAALQITGFVKELNGYVGYHTAMREITFAAIHLGMTLDEINKATTETARELLEQEEDEV